MDSSQYAYCLGSLFSYWTSNRQSDTRAIPSYFFARNVGEWVVFHLEGRRRIYNVIPQFIIRSCDGSALFLSTSSLPIPEKEISLIRESLAANRFQIDIRNTLPEDFSTRAILDRDQVVLIARTTNAAKSFFTSIQELSNSVTSPSRVQIDNSGNMQQHFKWSSSNWLRFCAKTAYEAICLFEGPDRCLVSAYDRVRKFVLEEFDQKGKEIIFNEHGPLTTADVPSVLNADLTNGQNAPQPINTIIYQAQPAMHSVLIYEIDGWTMSTVSFSGFPSAVLVLAGPDTHIGDIYQMVYDNEENSFDYVRLAYDPQQPIIPIALEGSMVEALKRTYRLKGFKAT